MRLTEGLMKWAYTFVLLGVTIWWGWFTINIVNDALTNANPLEAPERILEVTGASMLMGALIVWNGNVNQHWFRKRGPDEMTQDTIQLNKINGRSKKEKEDD